MLDLMYLSSLNTYYVPGTVMGSLQALPNLFDLHKAVSTTLPKSHPVTLVKL